VGKASSCPIAKSLTDARKALAEAPKAEEKLTAEQRAELAKARDFFMTTAMGKAFGPAQEASAKLLFAAAAQEGTPAEMAAILREMGATYGAISKMSGCCETGSECCKKGEKECCSIDDPSCCSTMAADVQVKNAKAALDNATKLLAAAAEERKNMAPELAEKMAASMKTGMELCPRMPAVKGAMDALHGAYAALAKIDAPKNAVRDELIKAAIDLNGQMCCDSCDECEECPEDGEKEVSAPSKSS
jgi:hypothetical protein